jgi:hypothetical protein
MMRNTPRYLGVLCLWVASCSDSHHVVDAFEFLDSCEGDCNPFYNSGCFTGTKCTVGYVQGCGDLLACYVSGPIGAGLTCTIVVPEPGQMVDNCVTGSYCYQSVCRTICDPVQSPSSCAGLTCTVVPELPFFGLCL